MRLATFISANTEAILADWIDFAGSVRTGTYLDLEALRDHAEEMLKAIALDLPAAQTHLQRSNKSKGLGFRISPDMTGAEYHGAGRAESGFSIQEMVSEFRALRASVLRLWMHDRVVSSAEDVDDIMRFNEAIDQALSESLGRFESDLDRSKEMFVAMMGHDLRTPLGAVVMGSELMNSVSDLSPTIKSFTEKIARSAAHMNRLLDDMLEFTKARIGSGLPLSRQAVNLQHELIAAVDEMLLAQPGSVLQLTTNGDLRGVWDGTRMRQVFSNLLGNATQYGTPGKPIQITATGNDKDIVFSVHNYGPAIPSAKIGGIFGPYKRLMNREDTAQSKTNLGLGLYIAERIVAAHGGSINVTSSDEAGTQFEIHLPR